MKKQIHILEGIMILLIILISGLLSIKFIYQINHEELDTSYMFDIKFNNLKVIDGSVDANIELENNYLKLDLDLEKENDFFYFTFDIENNGTLDTILKEYDFSIESEKNIFIYDIKYSDDTEIQNGDIIKSNSKKQLIIKINYPSQPEKIYESIHLKINLKMNYEAIY